MDEMNNAAQPLSDNDRKYILRAQQDKFEDGGIVRYYEQAIQKQVHEEVIAAIELRMRTDFPKAARQVFGANGEQAEEMLARVRAAVQVRYYRAHAGTDNMEQLQWFAAGEISAVTQEYLTLLEKLAVPHSGQA